MTNWQKLEEGSMELNKSSETWKPTKEGDVIEGIYKGKREKSGAMQSAIYKIDVDGTEVGVWASTVIESKVERWVSRGLQAGHLIRIEYLGEVKSERGRKYKHFDVQVAFD